MNQKNVPIILMPFPDYIEGYKCNVKCSCGGVKGFFSLERMCEIYLTLGGTKDTSCVNPLSNT